MGQLGDRERQQAWARQSGDAITIRELRQELEDVRSALAWALPHVPEPDRPNGGEYGEDYGGATRLAWPDAPENWWPE